MAPVEIKICGVTDPAFASRAEALGASYIGVIFAEGSPRRVDAARAREVVRALSGKARAVGVFTEGSADAIAAKAREAGVGIIQLHRRAAAEDVAALKAMGFEVWTLAGGAPADALLFDSSHGDGETCLRRGGWKTVLAGGIGERNLAAALASGADIVDVSGSLETSPGVKSMELLESFFAKFRSL